ncbi:MAG: class I SAM-dependent methyltransferase [Nannocystaceae bacterium]
MTDADPDPDATPLAIITAKTLSHYERQADAFWQGTRDHDVSQNREALLRHAEGHAPLSILDLGCGPGRDLIAFTEVGHTAVGLDGAARFCELARKHSGCEVWHQNLLTLDLPTARFHAVFANATLFHVPTRALPQVLDALWATLLPRGVLFCSNPRGDNHEGWHGERYGAYHDHARWRGLVTARGFEELEHYYRPPGRPLHQQPWLATVYRKLAKPR